MTNRIPTRINRSIVQPKSKGRTLTFDCSVTSSGLWSRDVIVRQSTTALVKHEDPLTRVTRLVGPNDFWVEPDYLQKHFIMLEGPYTFQIDLGDRSLVNSVTLDVKRMFCFSGQFAGRLTIRSDTEQTIKLSYA